MTDFLADLASELGEAGTHDVSLPADSKNSLLQLARLVAHNSERKNAPLAAFIIGRHVEARVRGGATPEQAVDEAAAVAQRLLGPTKEG